MRDNRQNNGKICSDQLTFVCQQLIKRVPPFQCFLWGGPADESRAIL